MNKNVLVVGRFQPLHLGHEELIRRAIETGGRVKVAIGSSDAANTARNPFTVEERSLMVSTVFGPAVEVVAVPDLHNPPKWVSHCLEQAGAVDVVFGNDDSTMDLFEMAGIDVRRTGLKSRDNWHGATIRAWLAEDDSAWKKSVSLPIQKLLVQMDAPARLRGARS